METIKGSILKVVFHSEESGFKVLKVKISSGPIFTAVGEFGPEIIPGTVATFHGDFKTHTKYGSNFKVASYNVSFNAEKLKSIQLFIDHIAPNIGPERAELLVSYFGENIVDILDNSPERLTDVPGIGKISAHSLKEAWEKNRELWGQKQQEYSLRVFLNNLGIRERRIKKILNYFGGSFVAEEAIKKDPYKLTEIESFGFTTADFIARKLGFSENDPMRLRAYTLYCLNTLCSSYGHLYLTREEIVHEINKYARESGTKFIDKISITIDDIEESITNLKENSLIIDDEETIYSKNSFISESASARKISAILEKPSDLILLTRDFVDTHIAKFEEQHSIQLSEKQKEALHYFAEKKVFVITGGPGTGKCLGFNTPILMYDGTIKMVQNIKKGDILMGDDSTPREVLSTCKGRENLYQVIPKKGDSYTINESHILSLKESGGERFVKGRIVDIPLLDYLKLSGKKKHHLKGYRVPASFPEKDLPIDPYLIGYWLGNGSSDYTKISTIYSEVVSEIDEIVTSFNMSMKKIPGDNVDYILSSDRSGVFGLDKKHPNILLNILKDYNLINNKHIPYIYKCNSRENQLRILAGILDADGFYGTGYYEITLKVKKLIDDIVYLCRSLGFAAYSKPVTKKYRCFRKNKHYEEEGLYYRVYISGHVDNIPCIIPHKKAKSRKQKKDVLVTGIKVKPIGEGDYYGFELTGNGRFLLGDFTVTHNTETLKVIVDLALKLQLNLTCMTPTGISAKKMAETINYEAYTIHRRLGFRGNTWIHGEDNKFFTDVVILDEASMVDQETFYRLLSALENRIHIIFVGDDNQLPSVSAGNVLRELINCGKIPVIRLEQIFRQDEASDIIKAAHRIKNGDTNLDMFKSDPKADVFFIRENDPVIIEDYLIKLATKFKDERRLFQIITARNEGPLSVNQLNNSLQNVLNSGPEKEIALKTFKIKKGDRIIVIKNDYEIGVYNGEIGKVLNIESNFIKLQIDDRIVNVSKEEASEKLKLAYSITIHRCVPKETFITSSCGLKKIGVMKEGDSVHITSQEQQKIIWHGETGKKDIVRIQTKRGYTVESSINHKFLVANKEEEFLEEALNIRLGDYACINRDEIKGKKIELLNKNIRGFGQTPRTPLILPKYLNEDISWLLGALIGNGSYRDRIDGTVDISNPENLELLSEFNKIISSIGLNPRPHDRKSKSYSSYVCSKNFRRWLYSIGYGYVTAENKDLPDIIFEADIPNKLSFIAGLLDTDGSVDRSNLIRYVTVSEKIAHKLQLLLLSCGIISSVTYSDPKAKNEKRKYYISISKNKSNMFNLRCHKKRNRLKDRKKIRSYYEAIPYGKKYVTQFLDLFDPKKTQGKKGQGLSSNKKIYSMLSNIKHGHNKLTYDMLERMIDILKKEKKPIPEKFTETLLKHTFFDEIISVTFSGKKETCDMEIKKAHLYIANGFICHNSQGQEYPYIILPFINQFGRNLLQRNLLYTAITRAKHKVIVIGHGSALEKAINNSSVYKRNTKLGERIKKCLQREKNYSFSEQLEEQVSSLTQTPEKEPF